MKKIKQITLSEACARYVHRYTMEHVPQWAKWEAPNGKFYAPQFSTDKEWFENTTFPPSNGKLHDCTTTGQTWPLGQWLDAPYKRATEETP